MRPVPFAALLSVALALPVLAKLPPPSDEAKAAAAEAAAKAAWADKVGAYQSFEEGRKSNVSCACHWTVNVAASNGHGKMYTDVYSVAPAGIFVPADSKMKTPADLAGVPPSARAGKG